MVALAALPERLELTTYLNLARGPVPDPVTSLPGDLVRTRWPSRFLTRAWATLDWPPIERMIGDIDVFHASDWAHPPSRRCPIVTTIHDVGALRHPAWYAPDIAELHRRKNRAAIERADQIVAISEFTRAEVLDLFPEADPARIAVVHNGVSPDFKPMDPDEARARTASLDLASPYLLYVGTRERRKNLPALIEAFALVAEQEPDVTLAIVGMRPALEARRVHGAEYWHGDEIEDRIRSLALGDRVRILGQVSPEELLALYNAAEALVFPTLYEGFGLPALEAMACGLPVVASSGTAVEEVLGGSGRLANPLEPGDFAAAVLQVLRSVELRASMRTRGLERASGLGWDRAARETLAVYRRAALAR